MHHHTKFQRFFKETSSIKPPVEVTIRKAYKFRLNTNKAIEAKLQQAAGCCRFVWNKALAEQKERLDWKLGCQSYNEMASDVVRLKYTEGTRFIKEVHSQCLQQTLMNLDQALKESFNKKNPKRFPRFKKRGLHDSFRYPQGFKIDGNVIYLPKVGKVMFRLCRNIEGVAKNVTVSKKGKYWYVSIQTERVTTRPIPKLRSAVGIDLGVINFATLSSGEVVKPLNSFKRLEVKLVNAQRKLSLKAKGSSNRIKQKARVNKIHSKIANARNDFLHKLSSRLVNENQVICLEDLNVKRMTEKKSYQQGTKLNKSILDQGWYEFRRQVEYKLNWKGGLFALVNPAHTSQTCNSCGYISEKSRVSQADFTCVNCGRSTNADLNASLNILARGYTVLESRNIKAHFSKCA